MKLLTPDSPERIALIAEMLGIPADAPMTDWHVDWSGDGATLTVRMVTIITREQLDAVISA